jgi:AI-2 transport protein TqsA
MSSEPKPINFPAIASTFGIIAISIGFLVMGKDIFIPLVLGLFIAYLIISLSNAFGRIRIKGRSSPEWANLTASIICFILGLAVLVQLIADNIGAAVDAAPQYQARFETLLGSFNGMLSSTFNRHEPITLATVIEQIDLGTWAGRFAAALQSLVGNTFEILIYVIFVLLEQRSFDRKVDAIFTDPVRRKNLRAALVHIGRRTQTYVLIKTLMSLIVGGVTYLTLFFLNVDFAAFFGLLAFLLNFIPYVGPVIGVVVPAMLALLQYGSPALFSIVAIILVLAHIVVGNMLEPRLMGHSLNLSPLLMIFALTVWGAIWGIAGMLLAVPLLVITMIILSQFPKTRALAIFMSENGEVN